MTTATRRSFIALGASTPALLTANYAGAQDATAPLPAVTVYRRPLGDREVITISDGSFGLDQGLVTNLDGGVLTDAMTKAYLDTSAAIPLAITVHLIKHDDHMTMVDAGAGTAFGPASGKLASVLTAAGIDPADIDVILLTHMHPDHIGGLIDGDGAVFPNAVVHVSATDLGFWTDEAIAAGAPESAQGFFALARGVASTYGDRLETFEGQTDMGHGFTSMPLPGHTPGHTGYLVDSGNDALLIWGDATAVAAYQFSHPEAGIAFDADGAAAAATRRAMYDMVITDRLAVTGTHLPFPGYGHVERSGDAYTWVPEEWKYL
ncbi:MBL fold metallo-hydrolase [Octadecabacter sp.]|nr:MBL fold metallo-hydrolase [Octadecabacter sp.]